MLRPYLATKLRKRLLDSSARERVRKNELRRLRDLPNGDGHIVEIQGDDRIPK